MSLFDTDEEFAVTIKITKNIQNLLKDNTENLKRDIKESKSTETGQLYGLVMKKSQ